MEGSNFTVKDIVIDTNKKLDKFIDKVEENIKETDTRLDTLEQHRASIMSNIRLAAWFFGAIGGLGGVYGLIKLLG